jgi:Holliday junction resolvasome RuvABC endonuclease subunit
MEWKPNRATILGIDPGKTSGWGITSEVPSPVFALCGVVKSLVDRQSVISAAIAGAAKRKQPLVAILEDWTPGGWKSFDAILRSGESRGRWLEHLELHGVPIVSVEVLEWRASIFGKTASKMKRDEAKTVAQTYVRAHYKIEATPDAAEAMLIARYGTRCSKISKLLDAMK